jgi:hypothetical protein
VTLFKDFGFSSLAEATAQLVKDMAAAGLISKETAFHEQQRRGVISPDVTWEDEQARIEAQGRRSARCRACPVSLPVEAVAGAPDARHGERALLQTRTVSHAVDLQHYSNGVVRRIVGLLNRADADLFAQLSQALEQRDQTA